jgi:hypothetical protein
MPPGSPGDAAHVAGGLVAEGDGREVVLRVEPGLTRPTEPHELEGLGAVAGVRHGPAQPAVRGATVVVGHVDAPRRIAERYVGLALAELGDHVAVRVQQLERLGAHHDREDVVRVSDHGA